jgi:hypothetical protein
VCKAPWLFLLRLIMHSTNIKLLSYCWRSALLFCNWLCERLLSRGNRNESVSFLGSGILGLYTVSTGRSLRRFGRSQGPRNPWSVTIARRNSAPVPSSVSKGGSIKGLEGVACLACSIRTLAAVRHFASSSLFVRPSVSLLVRNNREKAVHFHGILNCWLEVSIRKVLRPATSAHAFLGFPVP